MRSAGQSITERQFDLVTDKLFWPLLLVASIFPIAIHEWTQYLNPSQPNPWIFTSICAAALVFFAYRIFTIRNELLRLRTARDGERAVGEFLEKLRADGYQVFHDLVGDGFNLDHVLIGPAGVFTIETKTYSKPAKGKAEIGRGE